MAASIDRGCTLFIKIGIIANMLISSPTHISNQWELMIVIKVPDNKVLKIIKLVIKLISTGGI